MTYLLHDGLEAFDGVPVLQTAAAEQRSPGPINACKPAIRRSATPPAPGPGLIERPRLLDLLTRAHQPFAATLITGRAGTGKTCLAAQYAAQLPSAVWLELDTPDMQWASFADYLLRGTGVRSRKPLPEPAAGPEAIDAVLGRAFERTKAPLVVIDDLHKIFDTQWFGDLIRCLPGSVPQGTHVILISRTRPPGPFWRMRSKQMFNFIDEGPLSFTREEAKTLFRALGAPAGKAADAHRRSFGRAEVLARLAAGG